MARGHGQEGQRARTGHVMELHVVAQLGVLGLPVVVEVVHALHERKLVEHRVLKEHVATRSGSGRQSSVLRAGLVCVTMGVTRS